MGDGAEGNRRQNAAGVVTTSGIYLKQSMQYYATFHEISLLVAPNLKQTGSRRPLPGLRPGQGNRRSNAYQIF
jgi:hypothetical protein